MYSSVSNNFKTECKQDVNAHKRIAKIHIVEDDIDITNDDDLVEFTIEEMAYSENTFVGNSVAKKISLKIINDGSYNLENKEIEVYVGIDYVGDGSNVELIPYGNFIISKPLNEEVKDTSNYVGYDYMIKTEVPFTESNIVYPMSLYNYLSAICTSVGITLGNQSIPNGDYQILGNAYTNNENIRQIIEEIARCCGGFAVIGRDNKLYIRTLNANILPDEYQEVEYIESNGTNAYINTGVIPTANTKINIDFEYLGGNTAQWHPFYGVRETAPAWFCSFINKDNYKIAVVYSKTDTGGSSQTAIEVGKRYNLRNEKGTFYLNDVAQSSISVTGEVSGCTKPMYLFGFNNTGNADTRSLQLKIYRCKLYEGDTLIRDFIPCYRKSDNVIGLYDLVNDVFYTNQRTGTFLKGNDVTETITPGEYFEDFGTANTYGPVNRVAIALNYNVIGEDTIREDAESIVQNGLTEIRVSDISFLNSEAQRELAVDDFWTSLHGLTYKPYSTNYYGYPYIDAGDIVKITKPDNTYFYSYVLNHKFTYNGAFSGNVEAPALSDVEDEYKQTSTARSAIRNTELKVDKINGEIQSLIEEIGDRSDKQTTITQDIDRIELTVEDLEDLTYEVDGMNPITLEECVAGEILTLRIRGNNTVFDGLRPSNTLVPSNTLYPYGDSILIVKHYTENEQHEIVETIDRIDLGITEPLRYMNSTVFDEFRYDYDTDQKAKVIRRIGLTSGGEMYALAQEVIEPVDIDDIILTQGTNIIDIGAPYQTNVYADYVKQNQFTKIFTTQYQVSTQILQLANQISLIVQEKVDQGEIIASINLAVENEQGIITIFGNQIQIDSDNFHMSPNGTIKINNEAHRYDYDTEDVYLMINYILEEQELPEGLLKIYDYNNDNVVNIVDVAQVTEVVQGERENEKVVDIDVSIDPNKPNEIISLSTSTDLKTTLGLKGISTWRLHGREMFLGENEIDMSTHQINDYGIYMDGDKRLIRMYKEDNVGEYGIELNAEERRITLYNSDAITKTIVDTGQVDAYNVYASANGTNPIKGHCMHGIDNKAHTYACNWDNSRLTFYVDNNASGYVSDRRLKTDIKDIDSKLIEAISDLEFHQFIIKNRDGRLSVGVIAQELLELFDKYNINADDYGFVYEAEYSMGDETKYYFVDYEQLLILQSAGLKQQLKKQQEDIDYLKEEIKKLKGEK